MDAGIIATDFLLGLCICNPVCLKPSRHQRPLVCFVKHDRWNSFFVFVRSFVVVCTRFGATGRVFFFLSFFLGSLSFFLLLDFLYVGGSISIPSSSSELSGSLAIILLFFVVFVLASFLSSAI